MGTLSSAILSTPKFELKLPSNGKKVEYRPFLVKEEKALLMASESSNEKDMYLAMRDVVSACTFGKVEVEKLPLIDIEYVFLKIRSKSVGETSTPKVKCSKCDAYNELSVNLNDIEPKRVESHTTKIRISDTVIVEMRYPCYSDIEAFSEEKEENELERAFSLLTTSIDKIHTPTETFVASEVEKSEVDDFIGNLSQTQFKKLLEFFDTMPYLEKVVEYKCKKCNEAEKITLRSIRDFF